MAEKDLYTLKQENQRLRETLIKIAQKQAEIQQLLESVADLTAVEEAAENTPVTDEDVKSLLKKYSRII